MQDVQREINIQSKYPEIEIISKKVVKVKIMDISWLFEKGKTFADFVAFLADFERHAIFESKLVGYLLEEFWKNDQKRIIKFLMIPYFIFMIIAQWFII